MDSNLLLDEIKETRDRNLTFENVKIKIHVTEKLILELENQKNAIINSIEFEKKDYEVIFNQNQERTISINAFSKADQKHRHRMNELNLKRMSLEKAIESKKNFVKRLWCLGWLLKIPYKEDFVQVLKKDTNQKFTVNKKDVYDRFFGNIVAAEKARLLNEQSILRLKLDFNNVPGYPVHPEHEFYMPNRLVREKLGNIQEKILNIQKYEEQLKYNEHIEYHELTLGDFMNENSEQLLEQLLIGDEKRNIM